MNTQHNLPQEFEQRLLEVYGQARFKEIKASFGLLRPVFFRVNLLLTSVSKALSALRQQGLVVTEINDIKEVFSIPSSQRELLTHSDVFLQGHVYIQSLSSLLPVLVLNPQPNEEILDLTAAPGSKTTQMAVLMQNQGRIAAVEKSRSRYFKLQDNLKKQGVTCVDTYLKDGSDVWRHCEGRFDRVLVDAPCSSEGRFHLNKPDSMQYWSERKVKEMARKQWRLLYSGFRSVKPGGHVVYSTCTFSPEENEMQLDRLLKRFEGQVQLVSTGLVLPECETGLQQWRHRQFQEAIIKARRIVPSARMTGFFIAHLMRLP